MRQYITALLATTTSLLYIQLHIQLHLVEARVKIEALLPPAHCSGLVSHGPCAG